MADTAKVPATAESKKEVVKPEKPDEAVYQANLKKAEKELNHAVAKFNSVKAKLDVAQPKSKDSPSANRRSELLDQLKEIRGQQSTGKAGRNQVFDQIKKEDEKLKALIAEQKNSRARVSFKSAEEVDRAIERLEAQVNGGLMKLVDEKKALADISSLRKQRKGFAGFEDQQKKIDEIKAKIATLKKSLDDPESKALSEKYNKIQAEFDALRAEQDDAYKNINSLRDERTKLNDERNDKYTAVKKLKDDYHSANRALQVYEFQARRKQWERRQAERENFEKEKRKERAQKMLTEASDKAYLDEIRRAENLLRFLDPSYSVDKAPLQAPSQFQATAQRTVNDSGLKGYKVVKKEEEDYFAGSGGKKGKKGRKNAGNAESPAASTNAKYSCPPSVIEDCEFLKVDPPMAASDIPAVREKVKAKLDHWRTDQDSQTLKNIEKAKKEVERLEAEETNGDSKATASADEASSAKIETEAGKEVEGDLSKDLKAASLEEKA